MLDKTAIRAIVFDYGNTLIEFSRAQIDACDEAIAVAIETQFGPIDRERLRVLRDRNRRAIYEGDPPAYRENDNRRVSGGLVRELYGIEPTEEAVDAIVRARFDTFVATARAEDAVRAVLARLERRYALGILSNYPDGEAIRASLRAQALAPYLSGVVVSADVGFVKPHPIVFDTLVRTLGVPAENILFVGDNWLADIQGPKRAGMQAVLATRWTTVDQVERRPGDIEPDLVLPSVLELESYV